MTSLAQFRAFWYNTSFSARIERLSKYRGISWSRYENLSVSDKNYYCSFVYDDTKRARCKKKSRRYIQLSKVYKRVSERKRNKQRDCLHKASHLIAHRLAERAVVIGDHALRQMVIPKKEHEIKQERNKRRIRNRMVYNDWGLYGFVQMLEYKCLRFGKALYSIDERDTTKMCHACKHKQDMPLWKRTYRCANKNCGLVMDRDENSAVNIYQRFVAGPPPHTLL